ncbi:MAG: 5'-nucleotidase C-terminal domain-containing protein [Algicola sp.]|nr:5'-nucleotidase C-terminal domain-containing protein [Algicola sp.]
MIKQQWIKGLGFKGFGLAAIVLSVLGLTGCQQTAGQAVDQTTEKTMDTAAHKDNYRQFNVLAVNDLYNVEGIDARKSGGMSRLRTLRKQLNTPHEQVLLLHAGDFLFPSSMSSQYQGEQMIDLMNGLNGPDKQFDERFFVVFGNHEFDKKAMKYADMLAQRIEESNFYWLGSNVHLDQKAQRDSEAFRKSLINNAITEINGIKVGIYGLTTDIAIPEYASIDADYVGISKRNIADLKARGAEVVIAVTHLRIHKDEQLLKSLGDEGPDVIFGGHEHARQHVCVGKRCVLKADADLRSATIASITVSPVGEVSISHRYNVIDESTIAVDPELEQRTNYWINRYQSEYCQKHDQGEGCLLEVLGKADVTLVAEELQIRKYETNLGSYVADQMIRAFDNIELPGGRKVQIGLVNAGSLRLNQNIPAGTELNEWYLNGIFQYPVDLRLLEISGKTLKQVVTRSVEDWTGNGWFLQVSGMAFRHDAKTQQISHLSLVDSEGNITPVKDDDKILASVNNYMADPSIADQDGYTMLNLESQVFYADKLIALKQAVVNDIKAKWAVGEGIAPKLAGRICSSARPFTYCLLDKK